MKTLELSKLFETSYNVRMMIAQTAFVAVHDSQKNLYYILKKRCKFEYTEDGYMTEEQFNSIKLFHFPTMLVFRNLPMDEVDGLWFMESLSDYLSKYFTTNDRYNELVYNADLFAVYSMADAKANIIKEPSGLITGLVDDDKLKELLAASKYPMIFLDEYPHIAISPTKKLTARQDDAFKHTMEVLTNNSTYGIMGPVGVGKSGVTAALEKALRDPNSGMAVVTLSLNKALDEFNDIVKNIVNIPNVQLRCDYVKQMSERIKTLNLPVNLKITTLYNAIYDKNIDANEISESLTIIENTFKSIWERVKEILDNTKPVLEQFAKLDFGLTGKHTKLSSYEKRVINRNKLYHERRRSGRGL